MVFYFCYNILVQLFVSHIFQLLNRISYMLQIVLVNFMVLRCTRYYHHTLFMIQLQFYVYYISCYPCILLSIPNFIGYAIFTILSNLTIFINLAIMGCINLALIADYLSLIIWSQINRILYGHNFTNLLKCQVEFLAKICNSPSGEISFSH